MVAVYIPGVAILAPACCLLLLLATGLLRTARSPGSAVEGAAAQSIVPAVDRDLVIVSPGRGIEALEGDDLQRAVSLP